MMTKTDALSEQQKTAISLLVTGAIVTATAEQVGVARQTVSEWLNHSDVFGAALNARRQELFAEQTERLRALVPRALDRLESALSDERDGLTAAVHIVKAAGLYGLAMPNGKTDPEEIENDRKDLASGRTLREWSERATLKTDEGR